MVEKKIFESFKIKKYKIPEKQKKERDRFFTENKFNSGIVLQKYVDLLRDQIEEISNLFLDAFQEVIKEIISIPDENRIIDRYKNAINTELQDRISLLEQRINAANFPDNVRKSMIQNLAYKTNMLYKNGVDRIKYQLNNKKEKINGEQSKDKGMDISQYDYNSSEIWKKIEDDFEISKRALGKKLNFIHDSFKKRILFRDIEHAYILAALGFSKPSLILSGSVIEEILRLYLVSKGITTLTNTFDCYIKTCEENRILKNSISKITDAIRQIRNLIHIEKEEDKHLSISKSTAKGAVAHIFTIIDDIQRDVHA